MRNAEFGWEGYSRFLIKPAMHPKQAADSRGSSTYWREEQRILFVYLFPLFLFSCFRLLGAGEDKRGFGHLTTTYWGGVDTVLIDLHSIFHDRAKTEMGWVLFRFLVGCCFLACLCVDFSSSGELSFGPLGATPMSMGVDVFGVGGVVEHDGKRCPSAWHLTSTFVR